MPYKCQKMRVANRKQKIQRKRNIVKAYKASFGCQRCGIKDPRVLDLDHITGVKVNGISVLANNQGSYLALADEMSKCQVLCSNCHRIKTIENEDWR